MKKSQLYEYSKEELQKLLDESCTYADFFGKINMHKHGNSYKTLNKAIEELQLDTTKINQNRIEYNDKFIRNLHSVKKIPLEEIFANQHIGYNSTTLRNRLISEGYKEHICECCGLSEWMGVPIPLELHHKDGNRDNNSYDNLALLCPNCHALTSNYAGKNIKNRYNYDKEAVRKNGTKLKLCPECGKNYIHRTSTVCFECYKKLNNKCKIDNVDREKLKYEIRNFPMTEVGTIYDVTDNAIRKWCIKLGLPSHSREIKKYSDEDWAKI